MKAKEKNLEKRLREEVRKLGGLALKLWPLSYAGLPDRIILLPGGRVKFVELKSEGQKPNGLQLIMHGKLERIGFPVWVIDTADAVTEFLLYCQKAPHEV